RRKGGGYEGIAHRPSDPGGFGVLGSGGASRSVPARQEPISQNLLVTPASISTRYTCSIEAKALLIHPPHQGACGRHGTEEQCVTSGELAGSRGGTGVSGPISESEVASNAPSVVGLPHGI